MHFNFQDTVRVIHYLQYLKRTTGAKSMKCDLLTLQTLLLCLLMEPSHYQCQQLDLEGDYVPLTKRILYKPTPESQTYSLNNSSIRRIVQNDRRHINTLKMDFGNETIQYDLDRNKTNIKSESLFQEPKKDLPLALIIAGPTAAVSIFIFLCIAYYFHNAQLNRKAKRLSITLYVPPDLNSISSNCSSPTGTPAQRFVQLSRLSRDSDMFGPRRKSMLSVQALSIPPNVHNKRGSNWSALADQEILSLSAPRRHSTFIL